MQLQPVQRTTCQRLGDAGGVVRGVVAGEEWGPVEGPVGQVENRL